MVTALEGRTARSSSCWTPPVPTQASLAAAALELGHLSHGLADRADRTRDHHGFTWLRLTDVKQAEGTRHAGHAQHVEPLRHAAHAEIDLGG